MSEQHSEPVSAETGAETAAKPEQVAAAGQIEAPRLSPEQEETAPKADDKADEKLDVKADAAGMDAPKAEPAKVELPMVDLPEVETGEREEPRFPGKLMIMAPGARTWDSTWDHEETAAKPATEQPAKSSGGRRIGAMAAVVALATVAGAIGGALATVGLGHFTTPAVASAKDTTKDTSAKDPVEASLARIDGEIQALKSSIDQTARTGTSQLNKTNDRLDRVEKAQAEPMAKLAKLSEAVDKLRAAPQIATAAAAPTQVAARETTGTVTPSAQAAAAPKVEVGRLPVVDGWALRDVGNGGALIEGRQGIYEVYAGDPVPGLGRVDAIRKQDGRWVVVTTKGLIVSR